ncbi:MAG: 3-deoxy-D-manno-octulosonic acid transferase [Thermodesulfovibrionales bacterium]
MIYTLAYTLALAGLLPYEYLKRPGAIRRRWFRERFGIPGISVKGRSVWIHAVSVGETIAAVPLVKRLKERDSSLEVVLSTVTDTGQKVARERLGDLAQVIYMPFDLPGVIERLTRKINPSLFIIMETELWPNVIRILREKGVPVVLMNGRISERSFRGYSRIRFFMTPLLRRISLFCMQDRIYAERIRSLGADPASVRVIGSFKFDTIPSSPVPEWTELFKGKGPGSGGQGPVIIAGSTHRPEEEIILDAFEKPRPEFPSLSLILAPRHPERFREVEEILQKRGLEYLKRSEIKGHGPVGAYGHTPLLAPHGFVVLLDVIGELGAVYGAADIAVMGGSFIEHGGQNPLEPAFWGKPILCGPHMENFPFIGEFYEQGGAKQVDARSLSGAIRELLSSPDEAASMGITARALYEKNSGAVERAMELLERYL